MEYSNKFVNVHGNKKTIGILCHWYKVHIAKNFIPVELDVTGYYDRKYQKQSLPSPFFTKSGFALSNNIDQKVKGMLQK